IDPWQQIRGIQDAITYAQSRADVDAGRIGLWGSSYGAGNAYVAAAIDRRIKAVCGQVPMISGRRNIELFLGAEQWAATQELLAADRLARAQGVEPARMPIVPEEPGQPAMSGSPDSIEFFQRFAETSWVNDVTVRTLEYFYGYEPADYLKRIAPTPLLMIVAPGDTVAPGEWATEAYEAALHPKKLVLVPGGHYAAYIDDEVFELSVTAARDHFVEHLMAKADISA
ncbi:alpha/beta hydrolase, partial [Nocardia xishanensis]